MAGPSPYPLSSIKGSELELATKLYFQQEREAEAVYAWVEYAAKHSLPRTDTGIDLVAILDGEAWAIQCKNWNQEVDWNDLGSFVGSLAEKNLPFAGGYLIAHSLTKTAEDKLSKLEKTIITLPSEEILERYSEIARKKLGGEVVDFIEKPKKELRPYQQEALEALLQGFAQHRRGKLLMPPGTGKTLVALRFTEALLEKQLSGNGSAAEQKPPLVLFLCPSIALLDQSIKVWLRDRTVPLHVGAVVSDKTVGKDEELNRRSLLSFPATTEAKELVDRFKLRPDRINVLFSTYQSLPVVIEAQKKWGFPAFDLVIGDEAHRTAGVSDRREEPEESGFRLVHDENQLKAERRLYMTATPRVFDVPPEKRQKIEEQELIKIYDMSDETLFGPTFYEYTFQRGITEGFLAGYQVVVLVIDQKVVQEKLYEYLNSNQALPVDLATQLVGLGQLLRGEVKDESDQPLSWPIKSGIIFVSRVNKSQKLEREFRRLYAEFFGEASPAHLHHIDGQMSAFEKRRRIDWLRQGEAHAPHLLSNAKVLTEGIDVPSLDLVAFLDPKDSVVDIIQAIGRVVRKAPGKSHGLIFIPLVVQPNESIDLQFARSTYRTLWQVLSAIAALDKTFVVRVRPYLWRQPAADPPTNPPIAIHRSVLLQPELFEKIRHHLHTRIVKTYGLDSKTFLQNWAHETASLAQTLSTHLQTALEKDPTFKQHFHNLRTALQATLHTQISSPDIQSFIVQYLLTRPIFHTLFQHHTQETQKHLDQIFHYFKEFLQNNLQSLENFYDNVRLKAQTLTNSSERQEFLRYLYTHFFSIAFKDTVEEMGIAYTPTPLVEFILDFADYLCQKHWNKSWKDPGCALWEPFAGTGTFLALAIDRMSPENLTAKLQNAELWATEKLLLPFLLLLANAEDRLYQKLGKPHPFPTALWADTFQLMEHFYEKSTFTLPELFPKEVQEQFRHFTQAAIHFILSNPPWRSGRKNENIGRQNLSYPHLRDRIETTYAQHAQELGATNVNSLYDTYIQAIRMASDRIQENGLIAFVLNNGWLTGLAARGLRKTLQSEFTEIYLYDLKGDARTRGEEWKKQGDKIFESQSRAGVCLAFFVKKPKPPTQEAAIFYTAVPDYATREQKFNALRQAAQNPHQIPWHPIHPNPNADWIHQGTSTFGTFIKIGDRKRPHELTIFEVYSRGATTCRDRYVYNFSIQELEIHMRRHIENFNKHLRRVKAGEITDSNLESAIEKDPRQIKWDSSLKQQLFRINTEQNFDPTKIRSAYYRPFVLMHLYFDKIFISRVGSLPEIFPSPKAENQAIVIAGVGKGRSFDAFMTDRIVDVSFFTTSVSLFPLYVYKEGIPEENVTEESLRHIRQEVGDEGITKEDVFYYVFGVLSTPAYAAHYRENLLMELPRVPIVGGFWEVVEKGRKLAELQLRYDQLEPYEEVAGLDQLLGVQEEPLRKVRVFSEERRILLNERYRLGPLPEWAFTHRVGNYPPIRWIAEYLVPSIDKETSIEWSPGYTIGRFVELLQRLLTLSQETLKIKQALDTLFLSNPHF